nr:hypothetical protein [Tanacetum cinerariifolium]
MPTKIELTLEQSQQGVSYDVLVAICSSLRITKCTQIESSANKRSKVLRIFLENLPEHPCDTKVFTMKMEILLEPTSNKLLRDSNYPIHSYRAVCFETFRDYGKRANRQLYKFKEDDFVDLHLNDIEDMLILAVQHKLFDFNNSDIVNFIVALRMFIKSLIIKRRVEDLQLGVESYQKKLNITGPRKTFLEIEFKQLYTTSYKLPEVIYEDLNKQKRVMRGDELYKFSDGTLKTVHDEIHYRILDFHLGYNKEMSRRKWMAINKRRSKLMVELIDKLMRERRIIRNLERLVGARELKMDYKLMTRIV